MSVSLPKGCRLFKAAVRDLSSGLFAQPFCAIWPCLRHPEVPAEGVPRRGRLHKGAASLGPFFLRGAQERAPQDDGSYAVPVSTHGGQMTFSSAWRFSLVTTAMARASAAGSSEAFSTRSPWPPWALTASSNAGLGERSAMKRPPSSPATPSLNIDMVAPRTAPYRLLLNTMVRIGSLCTSDTQWATIGLENM